MSISVLAIDDSPTIRTMVCATLEDAGMSVTTADDGVAGLEAFDEAVPDLVITDVNMPRLDGFGVIDGIRKSRGNRSLPILVLTTESGADLKSRARAAGASGWVVKPFDPKKLVNTIHRLSDAGA